MGRLDLSKPAKPGWQLEDEGCPASYDSAVFTGVRSHARFNELDEDAARIN